MRISMYLVSAAAVLVWSGSAIAEQGMISTGEDLKQIEQDKKIGEREQSGRSAGPAAEQQRSYEQKQPQARPEGAVPPPR